MENNKTLATIFHLMANCYRYLGVDNRFRAIAYERVSRMLYGMREDISKYATDVKSLDEIEGIGESIAEKILEFLNTGRIESFEKLKKKLPYELLELMEISGFGPASLKVLHEKLEINNREDLIDALQKDKLVGLTGFGDKKIENMKRALKIYKEKSRMSLEEAERIGKELLYEISKINGVERSALAGSIRRKLATIGDIDIVIQAEPKKRLGIVNKFIKLEQIKKVLVRGLTKVSVLLKHENIQVDLRLVHDYEFGAAMLYFTGSKEHNIKLRIIAREKGFKINEYGIFDSKTAKRLAGRTEEEIYQFLNMKYIAPEERLDRGEIEAAIMD